MGGRAYHPDFVAGLHVGLGCRSCDPAAGHRLRSRVRRIQGADLALLSLRHQAKNPAAAAEPEKGQELTITELFFQMLIGNTTLRA